MLVLEEKSSSRLGDRRIATHFIYRGLKSMVNKRIQLSVTFVIILALSIFTAACGSSKTTKESPAPSSSTAAGTTAPAPTAKSPVELTLMGPTSWLAGEGIKNLIAAYEKASGNKIKQSVIPDDQYINIMKTKMSTNDAPDLLFHNAGPNYIPFSFLEPITGPIVNRLDPVIKPFTSADGKLFQAPAAPHGFFGVIYNKAVMQKAGIKVPLKTYKELTDASEKLLAMGVTPIGLAGKSKWTATQLPLIAGNYVLEKNKQLATDIATNKIKPQDSPEYVEMNKRIFSLKKYINKDYLSADQPIIQSGLLKGTIAMEFYPDVVWGDFVKEDATKANDLAYMPLTVSDDSIFGTFSPVDEAAFSIPVNAKHKAEANDFVNFMAQPDNFKIMNTSSTAPASGFSPYTDIKLELNPLQQSMADLLKANNIPTAPILISDFPSFFQFGDVNQAYNDLMAGKPAEQMLADWYKDYAKVNQVAKTQGF